MQQWILFLLCCFSLCADAGGEPLLHEKPSQVPEKVGAKAEIGDEEIGRRLEDIFKTTGWFTDPEVTVQKGVVFLYGKTKNHQFKDWASDLARHTQDVTAVVNKIVVLEPSIWDVQMLLSELLIQVRKMVRSLPAVLLGSLILFFSWFLARVVYRIIPVFFRDKMNHSLVHEVFARAISFGVFIFGIYFIFEMADLTTMALTVLSGTGLIGVILGIAFRDITENFLASVLLSVQNPFRVGDLVEIISPVSGYAVTGYVERLTLRVTILVLLDGNHLQIPNAVVYKSNIRNHSSNPHRRDDFVIPIGSNGSVSKAVEAALKVLKGNPAILKDLEPLVLVDSLWSDQVDLHVYYWVDTRKCDWMKVKSSLLRLIKQAFQSEGIAFFLADRKPAELAQTSSEKHSEGDSHAKKIEKLSSQSRPPEGGKNLLNTKR